MGWINRNVAGMTITSFCADMGYEMVTAILPGFLNAIGVAAAALGWIEGAADALSSFIKLGAGWYSDRVGHRKPVVTLGYFLSGTALSLFALAKSWPLILTGRLIAWFGKGIRGPLRDAMLADSTPPETRGRVFGLHRAGDTLGAVLGPLLGVALLGILDFRPVFVISLIPGLAAVAAMWILVRETPRRPRPESKLWAMMREMPRPYVRFLTAVGIFGLGDFSHTLLVMAAAELLTPRYGAARAGQIAALLYVVRNVTYAGASLPVGALADRMSKRTLLACGYGLGALTGFATAALFHAGDPGMTMLVSVFAIAGIYIGVEDALEGAIPADLTREHERGTAYGLMGSVNGIGDLAASAMVGTVWTVLSPVAAFAIAGALMTVGAFATFRSE